MRSRHLLAFVVAVLGSGCGAFFPSGGGGAPSTAPPEGWVTHPIRLNGVGYLPEITKKATVMAPGGATFDVKGTDGAVFWSAALAGPITDADTGEQVWIADFTEFCDVGEFYLEVAGVGQSPHFRVVADVYTDAYVRAMMGLHGQRCGADVSVTLGALSWSHKSCHTSDAYLTYLSGSETIKSSRGGWHDAGDYGKYVTNAAFTVGILLRAWEQFQPSLSAIALPIPEHGGAIPDFLAEVKWELDWLFTTQSDDGGVSHKVTALNFEAFVSPEQDVSRRYYTGVGTSATADFVAVMAAAGRLYLPFDPDFAGRALAAAQKGYAYLQAHPDRIFPETSAFHTGGYGDGNSDNDERLWAAAELWETTGDPALLADLEGRIGSRGVDSTFDYPNVANLGRFTYLLSQREGRDPTIVDRLTTQTLGIADGIVALTQSHPYGRGIAGYWWGSNGAVGRTAVNLAVANALTPDRKYLDGVSSALDHLLGRNVYDRSQVTGVGYNPPLYPHHRPSASDNVGDPWPGLLVGGQDMPSSPMMAPDWRDSQSAANLNEIAINYNAGFIYAAAAMLGQ